MKEGKPPTVNVEFRENRSDGLKFRIGLTDKQGYKKKVEIYTKERALSKRVWWPHTPKVFSYVEVHYKMTINEL
jgi:hypothetical protein